MDLILASTSAYRKALLARLGVPFRCVAPSVDEAEWKCRGLLPQPLAESLAVAKARSVCKQFPQATVIGCDQVACVDGMLLDKPGTIERAAEQIERLSGRTHELITSVSITRGDQRTLDTIVARLSMRPLAHAEIERYLAHDLPLDCVGSYKLESFGISLFLNIDCDDHTAITGLPLLIVARRLIEFGFALNQLR